MILVYKGVNFERVLNKNSGEQEQISIINSIALNK